MADGLHTPVPDRPGTFRNTASSSSGLLPGSVSAEDQVRGCNSTSMRNNDCYLSIPVECLLQSRTPVLPVTVKRPPLYDSLRHCFIPDSKRSFDLPDYFFSIIAFSNAL